MVKKFIVPALVLALSIRFITGCSGGEPNPASVADSAAPPAVKAVENTDPATVVFSVLTTYLSEEEVQNYVVEPVKKKYPHITVEAQYQNAGPENSLENLILADKVPDLYVVNSTSIGNYKKFGIQSDISELVKKHNFDVNRFKQVTTDWVKLSNGTDYLVGFPYTMHFSALYYNTDMFDRFGVAYPTDEMTWQEVTEVAKRMTRNVDGVQYRGLEPDSVYRAGAQLSLPVIDPKTYKSMINSDGWKKVYQMVKNIYDIPGNTKVQPYSAGVRALINGELAMMATLNQIALLTPVKDTFTSWDIASYPVWPERPGIGAELDAHVALLTSASKNRDAAFKVLETLMSDEVQLEMAKRGRVSVLKDKKFEEAFGSETEVFKGKRIEAIFKTTPAIPKAEITEYFRLAEITNSMTAIVANNDDINTALRKLEETMNVRITSEMAQKQ